MKKCDFMQKTIELMWLTIYYAVGYAFIYILQGTMPWYYNLWWLGLFGISVGMVTNK